jgi:hypothetical protein
MTTSRSVFQGIKKGLEGPGAGSSMTRDKRYVVWLSIGLKIWNARHEAQA